MAVPRTINWYKLQRSCSSFELLSQKLSHLSHTPNGDMHKYLLYHICTYTAEATENVRMGIDCICVCM